MPPRWLAAEPHPAATGRARAWLPPLLAGLMSATVCATAHALGPLGSGFVSGLPLVAAWTTLGTRAHSGSAAARCYVQAFRRGLGPRSVMCLGFACTAVPLGAGWAMALALAAGALMASRGPLRGSVQRWLAPARARTGTAEMSR